MRIWPTKRWWKRFAIGAAIVVALALIANGFMAWRTERRFQAKIAAIRAAGDPASIQDMAPKAIAADENAAAILKRLEPRLEEFGKEHGRFFNTPLGKDYDERQDRGEAATAEQIAAIRAIMDKYADIQSGLAAAAACEQYASMADFGLDHQQFLDALLNQQLTRFRTAGRFLNWRIEVLIADGQQEQAAQLGIEMLRLARHYDHEPTLVSGLVAMAVRSMAANSLYDALAVETTSSQLHAALEQELAQHEDPQLIVRALKSERAFVIDGHMGLPDSAPQPPRWLFRMFGWPLKRLWVGALDRLDEDIASAERGELELKIRSGQSAVSQTPTGHGVLADLLTPAIQAAYGANARITGTLRALRIFNALTQFRDEHGREASGLDELALPKEATIDPFSGEPLKLKHTDEGWIVYSVMANGVDDGGDFKELKDWGVAPARRRSAK